MPVDVSDLDSRDFSVVAIRDPELSLGKRVKTLRQCHHQSNREHASLGESTRLAE